MALDKTCFSYQFYSLPTPVFIVRASYNSVSLLLLPCILRYSSHYLLQTSVFSDFSFPSTHTLSKLLNYMTLCSKTRFLNTKLRNSEVLVQTNITVIEKTFTSFTRPKKTKRLSLRLRNWLYVTENQKRMIFLHESCSRYVAECRNILNTPMLTKRCFGLNRKAALWFEKRRKKALSAKNSESPLVLYTFNGKKLLHRMHRTTYRQWKSLTNGKSALTARPCGRYSPGFF